MLGQFSLCVHFISSGFNIHTYQEYKTVYNNKMNLQNLKALSTNSPSKPNSRRPDEIIMCPLEASGCKFLSGKS